MRSLIFAINLSVDGCCDHTAFNPDDEVLDYFARLTRDAGILLYGRKTYELMVPYWPEVAKAPSGRTIGEIEFAQAFASVPQIVVFSQTLSGSGGKNTTIVRTNLEGEIQKLKQAPGKSILTGGVSLPTELLELGLIDEIRIVIHPVVTGKGRRLFDDASVEKKLQLELVESQVFQSGCVALRYLKQR